MNRTLRWYAVSAVVLLADQITKVAAAEGLEFGRPVTVVADYLYFTLAHNPGAAFSILADAGGWQRWFFVTLGAVVAAAISFWILRMPREWVWQPLALALVLGGALGNVVDRLIYGYVIDFVQVYLPFLPWRLFNPWPAFNVADAAISVGAVMLVVDVFRGGEVPERREDRP